MCAAIGSSCNPWQCNPSNYGLSTQLFTIKPLREDWGRPPAKKPAAALGARHAAEVQERLFLMVTTQLQQMTASPVCSTTRSSITVAHATISTLIVPGRSWATGRSKWPATHSSLAVSYSFALQFWAFATEESGLCNLCLLPAVCSTALFSEQPEDPGPMGHLQRANHHSIAQGHYRVWRL